MSKVAILGANGFIGSRFFEMHHLGKSQIEVRPVVRSFAGLARLSRFDADWRIADALETDALASAFEGCDWVIHAVHGHPDVVEGSIQPVYRAAYRAGVKRMVYLSTASVHGQSPALGTDETSPVNDRQPQDYNNRKVRAERLLLKERESGSTEVVILRPGIVFGPRSRWIEGLADDLLRGVAFLVGDGGGICNSIYVDNLVHAIDLALMAGNADREAFLVGDQEIVTWSDLYAPVAKALGVPFEEIHQLDVPVFRTSLRERVDCFRSLKTTQALLPFFPAKLKRAVRAGLSGWQEPAAASPWLPPAPPAPVATMEMADLHQCCYKLPSAKAERILGYKPIVTFREGCRRSVEWLRFAGYPIVNKG